MAKITDAVSKLVDILEDFGPEERLKIIRAVMALFEETPGSLSASEIVSFAPTVGIEGSTLSPAVIRWMKNYNLTTEQLSQVFYIGDGTVTTIATEVPGKNQKARTLNAYILTGIRAFIATGTQDFEDKEARLLCKNLGIFSASNHATYLKERGNEFAPANGNWKLTQPGLKRGADLVHEIADK